MSLACKIGIHEWKGCKCTSCGKVRNEYHDSSSDCEKCAVCGIMLDEDHDWTADCEECAKCKKRRPDIHIWKEGICQVCKMPISAFVANEAESILRNWILDYSMRNLDMSMKHLIKIGEELQQQVNLGQISQDEGLRRYREAERDCDKQLQEWGRHRLNELFEPISEKFGLPLHSLVSTFRTDLIKKEKYAFLAI
jgi:hypothetical protein